MCENIDSGHATLRDQLDYDSDPKSLQEELYSLSDAESALKSVRCFFVSIFFMLLFKLGQK